MTIYDTKTESPTSFLWVSCAQKNVLRTQSQNT